VNVPGTNGTKYAGMYEQQALEIAVKAKKRQDNPDHQKKPKGFTLTELMITMAILMVIVAASSAGMFGSSKVSECNGAANAFAGLMDYAKVNSMANNVAFMIKIQGVGSKNESSTKEIDVYKLSSNGCSLPPFTASPLKKVDLRGGFSGITVSGVDINGSHVSGNNAWFCIKPDGTVRDSIGNLPSSTSGNMVEVIFRAFDTKQNLVGPQVKAVVPYMGSPRVSK